MRPLELFDSGAVQSPPTMGDRAISQLRSPVAITAGRCSDLHPGRAVARHGRWAGVELDDPSEDGPRAAHRRDHSLRDEPDDHRGFWLVPEHRRQGLMTEASAAVTRYWFEDVGRSVLRIPKAVDDVASRRISERQGMRVIATQERDYVSGRLLAEMWESTAETWRLTRP